MNQEMKLHLAEKPYVGIQGEGVSVGKSMIFLRLQGCPVGCDWCDSRYTWIPFKADEVPDAIRKSMKDFNIGIEDLTAMLDTLGCPNLWITGGEPLAQSEAVVQFIKYHRQHTKIPTDYYICTAGIKVDRKLFDELSYITLDVKAPSSKVKESIQRGCMHVLVESYKDKTEFKMVVDNTEDDKAFAIAMVKLYPDMKWTFQPLYVDECRVVASKWLPVNTKNWQLPEFAEWVKNTFKDNFNVRLGIQLHKELYPNVSRGI